MELKLPYLTHVLVQSQLYKGDKMLVFVVPLKSKKASKSWDYTSKLFEQCLKSICNQSSPNFKVVVVYHDKPDIKFSHPHISYVQAHFPAPILEDGDGPMIIDRNLKVITGLCFARKLKPSHTMVIDADDCVSRKLAEFVSKYPDSNGWFVDDGYRYTDGSKRILPTDKLYRLCGSTTIVRQDLYDLPSDDECADVKSLIKYHMNHGDIIQIMADKGYPLEPLPFPSIVYVSSANKDNLFAKITLYRKFRQNPKMLFSPIKKAALQIFVSQPLTESICKEFTMQKI